MLVQLALRYMTVSKALSAPLVVPGSQVVPRVEIDTTELVKAITRAIASVHPEAPISDSVPWVKSKAYDSAVVLALIVAVLFFLVHKLLGILAAAGNPLERWSQTFSIGAAIVSLIALIVAVVFGVAQCQLAAEQIDIAKQSVPNAPPAPPAPPGGTAESEPFGLQVDANSVISIYPARVASPPELHVIATVGPFVGGSSDRLQRSNFVRDVCDARAVLDAKAATMAIVIGRHDKTPLRGRATEEFGSNQGLAQRRAEAVAAVLPDLAACPTSRAVPAVMTLIGGPRVTRTPGGSNEDAEADREVVIYTLTSR